MRNQDIEIRKERNRLQVQDMQKRQYFQKQDQWKQKLVIADQQRKLENIYRRLKEGK